MNALFWSSILLGTFLWARSVCLNLTAERLHMGDAVTLDTSCFEIPCTVQLVVWLGSTHLPIRWRSLAYCKRNPFCTRALPALCHRQVKCLGRFCGSGPPVAQAGENGP